MSIEDILAELRELAQRITGKKELVEFQLQPVELEEIRQLGRREGLEIDITSPDLTICPTTGIFLYKGQHILLFIPDHSYSNKFEKVVAGKDLGNRFHLCDCSTIYSMMENNRFQRYKATNNTEGIFPIVGSSEHQKADVALKVCKNCLNKLNYWSYAKKSFSEQSVIFENFSLNEFFKENDTQFNQMPKDIGQEKAGYPDNWKEISQQYRKSVNWCCEDCGLNLAQHRYLLDVHHINGVKHDCTSTNLRALCKECHAKQAFHKHYRSVSMKGIDECQRLRRWQHAQQQDHIPAL